jgi:hypothetical protein
MPLENIGGFVLSTTIVAGGWVAIHRLNKDRERRTNEIARKQAETVGMRNRKADLLQFLMVWKRELRGGLAQYGEVAKTFDERKRELARLTSLMIADYPGERSLNFSEAVQTITETTADEISRPDLNSNGREFKPVRKLLDAVDMVIRFVETK